MIAAVLADARQACAPPAELTVSEFADAELVVTSGPKAGTRWRTDFAPYQRGIQDAVHEAIEFVVVMGSSQWGKTASAVNVVCYHMAHAPCPILIVEPTVDPMAKDFAKNRLDPMIRASPALEAVVDKKRAKDASNTTLLKTYRGGYLALAGSNSAASLAARPVQLLILDEVDRYERTKKGEGDTLTIAIKRTLTFKSRRRVLMLSSPTMSGGPIHDWFLRGDQRRYFVPCPGCGTFQTFEWKHIRWQDDDPKTARIVCSRCGYAIDEAERVAILQLGEWRATATPADRKVVSFHLWEAYSPLSSLEEIVASFLRARAAQKAGDHAPMHTWQNTTLGEPVEPDRGVGVEPHGLLLRREEYGEAIDLPAGVAVLTMGVDVQDARLEASVWGWGLGEEAWIVDHQTFWGDTSTDAPWDALTEAIAHEYRHALGIRMPIRAIAIDSAGHRTDRVYYYAYRWGARRVSAIIGRDGDRPLVYGKPSEQTIANSGLKVPLWTVGVDAAKALLMSRLLLERTPEAETCPGYVHLPNASWCGDEFVQQLTSERLKRTFERGVLRETWVKIRARNEALDCAVYALWAFCHQQPDAKRRGQWLQQLHEALRQKPAPPPVTPPKKTPWIGPRRPGGWVRGQR